MVTQPDTEVSILIVDDDAAIRDSLFEFIEMAGYRSFKASSSEEALELLKNRNFNVVVTDILLPGMDGLELTDVVKKISIRMWSS